VPDREIKKEPIGCHISLNKSKKLSYLLNAELMIPFLIGLTTLAFVFWEILEKEFNR
jgi:hypothetical protein